MWVRSTCTAVRPFPVVEAKAWLAVPAVERDAHRDCAGTLVELHHEEAVIVAISGYDEALGLVLP